MLAPLAIPVDNLLMKNFSAGEQLRKISATPPVKPERWNRKVIFLCHILTPSKEPMKSTSPQTMCKNSQTGGNVSVTSSDYNHVLIRFTELKSG